MPGQLKTEPQPVSSYLISCSQSGVLGTLVDLVGMQKSKVLRMLSKDRESATKYDPQTGNRQGQI